MKKVPIRRTDTEKHQVGDLDDTKIRRYYDQNLEMTVVKLITGDCYTTENPSEMLVTILGSCIAVCARDPIAKVGGMNHILLPGSNKGNLSKGDEGYCTRFGAFAMEELINNLMKLGAQKNRLEIKIFGGANVIKNSSMIGSKNITFVKEFLKNDGLQIISEHVGGQHPRRIHYFPDTGKVKMRVLRRKEDNKIVTQEENYQHKIDDKKIKEQNSKVVELF